MTNSEPLSITPGAMRAVIAHCVAAKRWDGGEACGFVFGSDGVARRAVAIKNVAADVPLAVRRERGLSGDPAREYFMDDTAIITAMAVADQRDEDLIAVYHSHVASLAIPSDHDLATRDHDPAYLIVSLKDAHKPSARAWRMSLEYLGEPLATEVLLHISDDGQAYANRPPEVPWALTPENKVEITYRRGNGEAMARRKITAVITGHAPDRAGVMTLGLTPKNPTDPASMPTERIIAVRVLAESPQAGRVRQKCATYARGMAHAVEHDDFMAARGYAAYLAAAFPLWLEHS